MRCLKKSRHVFLLNLTNGHVFSMCEIFCSSSLTTNNLTDFYHDSVHKYIFVTKYLLI